MRRRLRTARRWLSCAAARCLQALARSGRRTNGSGTFAAGSRGSDATSTFKPGGARPMKRAGWGRAAALGLLLALAAAGCRDTNEGPTATAEPSTAPSEGMRGISLQNFHVGDTRWVLQADTASVYRDRKRVEAEWVSIDFFEKEEHVSTLTADRAILLQNTDDLEARGNVRVVSDDGAILKTEVLFWDHGRSKVHTDQFVEITRGGNVLTGVGMEADPGLDRVDLQETVRGSVRDAEVLAGEPGGGEPPK